MNRLLIKSLLAFITLFLIIACVRTSAINNYFAEVRRTEGGSKPKILVLWGRGLGEEELLARMKIAAKNQNIDLSIVSTRPRFLERIWLSDPVNEAIERAQPDFIFSLQHEVKPVPGIPNYLWLSLCESDLDEELKKDPSLADRLKGYDGFLCAYDDTASLARFCEENGFSNKVGSWFPAVYNTNFEETKKNDLFYCGANWDKRRSGADYQEMFKKMDKEGYLKVYGLASKWKHTPKSFGGHLPSDGRTLLQAMSQCGIALILHSDSHIKAGAISSRIFESSATSCVAISDPHPFVKKYFGNDVLYLDTQQSGPEIFNQIDRHIKWIHDHPEEAKKMALRCHDIATNLFSLEGQLDALIDFHKTPSSQIAAQKKGTYEIHEQPTDNLHSTKAEPGLTPSIQAGA